MKLLRGWIGEKKTIFKMWLSLDAKTYRRFHNVIIPAKSGTTQIDHILVSPYGLFIDRRMMLKQSLSLDQKTSRSFQLNQIFNLHKHKKF